MDGYTRSLGGMETPGALVVARIPSANVPVCVLTSVAICVLKRTQSVSNMVCVGEMACECMRETETQTVSDGRREWRAEWAASSYFENRAGLTGRSE